MAELVYARRLGRRSRKGLEVQILSEAPINYRINISPFGEIFILEDFFQRDEPEGLYILNQNAFLQSERCFGIFYA